MTPFELRPLGLGELLDRAITLCVRSFAVFAAILALVDIPLTAFELATDPTPPDRLSDIVTTVRQVAAAIPNGPPGNGRETRPPAVRVPDVRLMAVDLGEALLAQLATLACAAAAVRGYVGQRPSVLRAYRKALRRFPLLIASDFAAAGVALALGVICLPAVIIASLALAAFAAVAGGFVFFSVAAASLGFGLLSLFAALVNFAGLMMLASIAFDDAAPLRSGLRRTFGAGTRRRSACAAAIVLAVSCAGWVVGVAAGDGLTALTHNVACSAILQSLAGAGSNALCACFAVAYAFDVRIRREGFDLTVAAGEPVGDFSPLHPNAWPT